MKNHVCTADDPWTPEKSERAEHPDAKCVYDCDDYESYECPNCDLRFKVTLPSH